jgi:hypothetical protein
MAESIPPLFVPFQGFNFADSPVVPVADSSGIDWSLIDQIDPYRLQRGPMNRLFNRLINELPSYKFSSNDFPILSTPLSIRFFLLAQVAVSRLTASIAKLRSEVRQQRSTISDLSVQLHAYEQTPIIQSEKCYACGKRFINMQTLTAHIQRRHRPLVPSWKKIISKDYLDEDTQRIAGLKAEIQQLRISLNDQTDKTKTTLQSSRKSPPQRPRISSVTIQPPHGPFQSMYPSHPELFSPDADSDDIAWITSVLEAGDRVHREAERVREEENRRKTQELRSNIQARLEESIPLRVVAKPPQSIPPIQPQGSEPETEPPMAVLVTDSGDPFMMGAASDAGSSESVQSAAVPVVDLSDSDYSSQSIF